MFNTPQDFRNALGLIKRILKNNEVVEEFKALSNKKKWWKPAKNANLAKTLILTAGDIIEGRYWKGRNLEGKDGWKVVRDPVGSRRSGTGHGGLKVGKNLENNRGKQGGSIGRDQETARRG